MRIQLNPLLAALALGTALHLAHATQSGPAPAPAPVEVTIPTLESSRIDHLTNQPLRSLGAGIYEIGLVRIDAKSKTLTFPAVVNMTEGPIEYFIVTSYGSKHESVFRTSAAPFHIHLGALLLSMTSDPSPNAANDQPSPATSGSGQRPPTFDPVPFPLSGPQVHIEIRWLENGREIVRRPEDLLLIHEQEDKDKKTPKIPWIYNGSFVEAGVFYAELIGNIASLISDRVALLNNTGFGFDNDELWRPNKDLLPPIETPVKISIRHTEPTSPASPQR